MNRDMQDDSLRSSLLDRFVDAERGAAVDSRQTLSEMMDSVKRDLENLLNTRYRVSSWPPTLEELKHSLVNYGVPDFCGINMSSVSDRALFRDLLEEAIHLHEPRFLRLKVELVDQKNRFDRVLQFRIDGLLRTSPEPAEVKFDSSLDPKTNRIQVSNLR